MKFRFFLNAFMLGLLSMTGANAAEYIDPTANNAGKIQIDSAVVITDHGERKRASILLIAKDSNGLRKGQIYRASFSKAESDYAADGRYYKGKEIIVIEKLLHAGFLEHHVTLERVSPNSADFRVIEAETAALDAAPAPEVDQNFREYNTNSTPSFPSNVPEELINPPHKWRM